MPARQGRDDQNSSCALFLSIIFVLMLFGSGKDSSRAHRLHMSTTTVSPHVFEYNSTFSPYDLPEGSGRKPPSRASSAKVVILLFGTLMMVQMLGFCFVIALRRRAINARVAQEYSGTQISRGEDGWGFDAEDREDDPVDHPVIARLNAAEEDPDLPSYHETMLDGGVDAEPPSYEEVSSPDGNPVSTGRDLAVNNADMDDANDMISSTQSNSMALNDVSEDGDCDIDSIGDDVPLIGDR